MCQLQNPIMANAEIAYIAACAGFLVGSLIAVWFWLICLPGVA